MSFTSQPTDLPATSFRKARRYFLEAIPSPARMGYYRLREMKKVVPAPVPTGSREKRESSIFSFELNVELVTLSAGATGVGQLLGEEGIANLVRAFLSAGAKAESGASAVRA